MSNSLDHPITQLASYRELTPVERQAVQEHLAVCDECRAQFEAFRRQDALLLALPARLPKRRLELAPRRAAGFWQGVAWLGNVMAVSGTATVGVALAILVYVVATAPVHATRGSAPIAPGIPINIPDDLPMRVNPWVLAAPWIGGTVAVAGLLFALGRRSRKWSLAGVLFSLTLAFGFVSPLSALPNLIGIVWRATGGYSYDPNLPLVNWWIVRGDPVSRLQPFMDRMIGQVGLDPLDPVQPLARYHLERVIQPRDTRFILVRTRFIYADGSNRVYDVPMAHPYVADFGYLIAGWLDDGMQRLRAEHLALEGQPFASASSPIRLGGPTRLKLSPQAERLDAINPTQWLWLGNRMQHLVWSPQGDAFLMIEHTLDNTQQLWLVPLDGSGPKLVYRGSNVFEYDWSPDGQFIVYTVPGEMRGLLSSERREPLQLVAVQRESPEKIVIRRDITNASRLPSLTRQGIWYAQDGALWLVDYQTGQATRVTALPDYGLKQDAWPTLWPVAVSPDASRVAYACENNLCVMDLDGGARRVVPATGIRAITWDRTGARLATVSLDWNNLGPVRLLVVSREGQVQQDAAIAPRDATETPQWTPDGKFIFVQTYPMNGRRILTVNADTGQVLDLSREHWDAYFALSPDGKSLLLNNGRGGFWLAPIVN